MKSKSFILVLISILVLATSVSIVFAESASVYGHTFTIPDGYNVKQTDNDTIALVHDSDHEIVVVVNQEADPNKEIVNAESKGYKFTGQSLYKYGDFDVVQQNYNATKYTLYTYVCSSDKLNLTITLIMPSSEPALEGTDNPVCKILDTIN